MRRTRPISLALLCVLFSVASIRATEYFVLDLHQRVQASDTVVLARVVDPARALVHVERVLKGEAPKQITLVAYVDGFAAPAARKPLIADTRELFFLRKKDDAYAPLQGQYGRVAVSGDRLVDSSRAGSRTLSQTVASIQRLVTLQARAARSDSEADSAYVAAFANSDAEVQKWALSTSFHRIKAPSPTLANALLARWKNDTYMLGPDSLGDLRLGAKDADEQVTARSVVDSYNLLELERLEPRWPPASGALIAEVRTFLIEMQRDPARLVSNNAKSMLALIASRRP